MKTHDLVQGSPAWHQFRLEHNGASEAAAMLGLSMKVRRTELLHVKHTGNAREFSDWVQKNILDKGHEVEAAARPVVEGFIGEDLYPVTCSDGKLSASCDGLTMSEEIAFEHKQWNEELAALVAQDIVPDEHMPQCQQILMVTKAVKVIFVVSDGTEENMVHTEVLPDPTWFDRIKAGWDQFDKDLAEYEPAEVVAKPVAKVIRQLPALSIKLRGDVVDSNLDAYRLAAEQFIEGIKTDLETDEDFANAEANVKFCEEGEARLKAVKEQALGQTATIDELFRTIDHISEEMRQKRLELSRLVTSRKVEIKDGIVVKARKAYAEHVAALKTEAGLWLPLADPDFATAAKNKRTLASLQDAVDTALANGKIAADAHAKTIRNKRTWIAVNTKGYEFLFADEQLLIAKSVDDLDVLVASRIDKHKEAEAQKVRDAQTARDAEIAKAAETPLAPAAAVATLAASAVRPVYVGRARVADTRPPFNTTALCERLGFTVSASLVQQLGVKPAPIPEGSKSKTGTFWHEADFPQICGVLIQHLQSLMEEAQV